MARSRLGERQVRDADFLSEAEFAVSSGTLQTDINSRLLSLVDDPTPQLGGDLDGQGHYLVGVQNISDLNSKGARYFFDGEDGSINIDAALTELANSEIGCIIWKGIIHDFITNDRRLWGFGDASAVEYLLGTISGATDYVLKFYCVAAGGTKWVFNTDNVFLENTEYVIILLQNGTSPVLYINGKLEPITFTSSIDLTAWFNTLTGLDTGRIGASRSNSGVDTNFLNCSINGFDLLSLNPTTAEIKALSSGASVPYKYIGANQTDIMSGWDFTSGWTVNAGMSITDADTLTAASAGSAYKDYGIEEGKSYRLDMEITSVMSSNAIYVGTGVNRQHIGNMTVGSVSLEFVVESGLTNTIFHLYANAAGTIDITSMTLTQIGCVLQLEQPGIGHSQWLDNSGNELHGEVSGAIPTNLPVDNIERFRHTAAITDDTSFTDIVPQNYMLESIIFEETAGNIATLDLGTTVTGSDVFKNQVVTANGITTVVIDEIFSTTAAQSLYLNDDDVGSSFNNASLTATLLMRRVI